MIKASGSKKQAPAKKSGWQVMKQVTRDAEPSIKRILETFAAVSELLIIFVVIVSVPVFRLSAAVFINYKDCLYSLRVFRRLG